MSLSKFGPRNRSLKQHPWIVNCICSPTRQHKGQTVDVIRHLETQADGSLVREVTDGQVIIRAVFSTEAVQKFRAELEDSDSCPVEWNQALLLVLKYHAEFRPHRNLAQCEFVLHIDLFKLWDLKEGFFRKRRLVYSDEDARIQKKMKELWEEKQIEWQIEEEQKNCKPTGSCLSQQNESNASVSLTQLLEEIARDADDAPTSQDAAGETAKQRTQNMMTRQSSKDGTANTTVGGGNTKELEGKEDDMTVQDESTKQATQKVVKGSVTQDLKRPFIISELLIPDQEQLILKEIAEWKEGYMPETSVTASSEEAGSSDKVESYVPHTLVDDVSSMETTGQPSPPKKGRNEFQSKKRTDNQEKSVISRVPKTSPKGGSCPGSPQLAERSASSKKGHNVNLSTHQNTSKALNLPLAENDTGLGKTVNLCTTNSPQENTKSSSESLNNSGPFQVCDFLESQGFIPSLSPDQGPNSISAANRERVDVVSIPQSNKSLEALEMEEEKRLEKLATPSKGFCGYKVNTPARTLNDQQQSTSKGDSCHTKTDCVLSEDEPSSIKQKSAGKKIPREETPYSSSQTDCEPESQVKKRRRLAFSVVKQKGGNFSSPESNKNTTLISKDTSCQPNPDKEAVVIVHSSPESQEVESVANGNTSKGTDVNLQHIEADETANNSVNETIMVDSSHDSTSSGNSPSVLTYRRRKEDHSDLASSLPSYQPVNCQPQDKSFQSTCQSPSLSPQLQPSQSQNLSLQTQPSQSNVSLQTLPSQSQSLSLQTQPSQSQSLSLQTQPSQSQSLSLQTHPSQSQKLSLPQMEVSITDKAKLLSSLTEMTAPTEPGQKLLQLKFCDRLFNQIVDFYTHK